MVLLHIRVYVLSFIPSILAYIAGDADRETVRFVSVILRHGHSNPTETYPKDPYIGPGGRGASSWPGGRGALSSSGSLQMFTLGRALRRRYFRLFPPDGRYSSERMHAASSSAERNLMSCQSLLAGFMPPVPVWNPLPIAWQPIPVHSIPANEDNLILQESSCRKYDRIFRQLLTNPPSDVQGNIAEYAKLFGYLTEHSGMKISNVVQAAALHDILLAQQIVNLTLPSWTDSVFPDRLHSMVERALELRTKTKLMKRIKAGPLITKIVNQMQMKQSRALPKQSIAIYCGYDTTLASVMHALNITDQTSRSPNYGAAFSIELHCAEPYEPINVCNDDYVDDEYCNRFEVKIIYLHDENDDTPKHVNIPKCPQPCSLSRFIDTINDILIYDYNDACKYGT